MGRAEWSIKDGRLYLHLYWQEQSETSDSLSGKSTCFDLPLTTVESTANFILGKCRKTFNLDAFTGINEWNKLV